MPKIAHKTAQDLQNLKISVRIDPKPTVEGGNSCFELSSEERFRRSGNVENIQEYLWTRGLLRSREAAESSYVLEREKPAGASIFSRIFSNTKVRRTRLIFLKIFEKNVLGPSAGAAHSPQAAACRKTMNGGAL